MTTLRAVIVAAGLSSRLYPLTKTTPKGLLPFGDETILRRSIRLLKENGVAQVAVVAGFRADAIASAVGEDAAIVINPFYRGCNNMGSLMMARGFTRDEPFIYMHGDLVYTGEMLGDFLREAGDAGDSCLDLLTDFGNVDEEAMKVRTDGELNLIESSKDIPLDQSSGEWTGIAAVHKPVLVFSRVERHLLDVSLTDYDTAAFTALASGGARVRCLATNGDAWREIDTAEDLEAARLAFGVSG